MTAKRQTRLIIGLLWIGFLALYTMGEFLGCYHMLSGSSGWCEPLILWWDA